MKNTYEARHDGLWMPRHQTRRNETGKKPVYYIALDFGGDFNYGQYLMPNGNLTDNDSNRTFDTAAFKTVIPAKLDQMAKLAVKKYGDKMYVHVFRQDYSHGTQTHKDHMRPAELIDKWSPKGKYWLYDYAPVEALVDNAAAVNEDDVDESIDFNKNNQFMKISCRSNPDYNGTYDKADVEDEMRDVGVTPHSPSEWIEWVLEHMFSDEIDWTARVQDAFMLPNVMKMEVSLGNSIVKLEKPL